MRDERIAAASTACEATERLFDHLPASNLVDESLSHASVGQAHCRETGHERHGRHSMADKSGPEAPERQGSGSVGLGMALGAGIGVAIGAGIGAALGSVALGAGVGVALGPAIGMLIAMKKG